MTAVGRATRLDERHLEGLARACERRPLVRELGGLDRLARQHLGVGQPALTHPDRGQRCDQHGSAAPTPAPFDVLDRPETATRPANSGDELAGTLGDKRVPFEQARRPTGSSPTWRRAESNASWARAN